MSDKITKAKSPEIVKQLREARIQEEIDRLTNGMSLTGEERKAFEKIVRGADAMNKDSIYPINNNTHTMPKKNKRKNPFKSLKNNANDLVVKVGRGANMAKNYIRHAINDHKKGREI